MLTCTCVRLGRVRALKLCHNTVCYARMKIIFHLLYIYITSICRMYVYMQVCMQLCVYVCS